MTNLNIFNIIFTSVFIMFIVLFFVSLAIFIRNRSNYQKKKFQKNMDIERKLDKIIELLEKKNIDKIE